MSSSSLTVVTALYRALEAGKQGAELSELFTDDMVMVERPNLIKPTGARATRSHMLANSAAGASLLSRQKFDVHSAISHGDTVIVRLLWTGTIARDVAPFHAGQELTAHVAQFIQLKDGQIASIETYDCYEPFA